jgi:hypothetical protein
MDDEGDAQPIARNASHQFGADGAAPHGQHQDTVDVAMTGPELHRSSHPPRDGQLARHLQNPLKHPLRVDAREDRGVIEGYGILEVRGPGSLVVVTAVSRAAARFLVRGLVAEEVARVHQEAAAGTRALPSRAPAISRPALSMRSTSSGERASV